MKRVAQIRSKSSENPKVSVYLPIEILPLWFSEKDVLRPKQPKPKQALKLLNCSHAQPYGYDATMGHLGRFFHVGVLRELCQDHRKQGLQCSCTTRHVLDSGCAKLLCFVFVMPRLQHVLTCFQDLNTFHRGSKLLSPDWRIARFGLWHVSFNRAMDLHPGPTLEADLQLIFPSRVRIWWGGKHDTYVKTKPKKRWWDEKLYTHQVLASIYFWSKLQSLITLKFYLFLRRRREPEDHQRFRMPES